MREIIQQERIQHAMEVDLPAFIEHRTGLPPVKKGSEIFFISPFRDEKNASLIVTKKNSSNWWWFDFGSANRLGGNAINFEQALNGGNFTEAVNTLLQFDGGYTIKRHSQPPSTEKPTLSNQENKMKKIIWVNSFYRKLPSNYKKTIEKFFGDRGLQFHENLGIKVYAHFKDNVSYIVFPLPNPQKLRGLELREICSLDKELGLGLLETKKKKRKNYGTKTIWYHKRNTSSLLITESIIDSLAGEVILGDNTISLASLNGVGQANQINALLNAIEPPKNVILALDKDEQGQEAENIIKNILNKKRVKFEVMNFAQKDLFRQLHSDIELSKTG